MASKKTAKKAAPAKSSVAKRYPIVVQMWEESEAGWGIRPDGYSIHLTDEDRQAYCAQYWIDEHKRNPSGVVPECYSREGGTKLADVSAKTYNRLKKSKDRGLRFYSERLADL